MEIIDHCVLEEAKKMYLPLKKKVELRMALFDSFRRLDILQELIDDKDITEIMINGTENIFVENRDILCDGTNALRAMSNWRT